MSQIKVKAGSLTIIGEVTAMGSVESKSSGKRLEQLTVAFDAPDHYREEIEEFLGSDQPAELSRNENPEHYLVRQVQTSTRVGSNQTIHTWELTKKEDLKLTKLVIGELELVPYRYQERFDSGDTLTGIARVKVTEDERQRLVAMKPYFPVVRKGINESPREMRFGQFMWSYSSENKIKLQLVLVDKSYDEKHPGGGKLLEPEVSNIGKLAITAEIRAELLLEVLKKKGILSPDEVAQVEAEHAERRKALSWELAKVDDLDDWLKDE